MPQEVPTDIHEYHLKLIEEIGNVTQHMKTQPPKKYNFSEWAFYLKLIGEDERSADRHQKAVPKPSKVGHDEDGQNTPTKENPEKLQWSWVGSRSPLMGSQEEAEWILEKLEQRLKEELTRVRDAARKR